MGVFKKPTKPRSVEPSSPTDVEPSVPTTAEPSVPTDSEPSVPATAESSSPEDAGEPRSAEPSNTTDAEPSVPDEAPVKTVTHLKENSETPVVQHRVVTLDPLETPVPVSPGVREQEKMLLGDLA